MKYIFVNHPLMALGFEEVIRTTIDNITSENNGNVMCLYVCSDGIFIGPFEHENTINYNCFYPYMIVDFLNLHPHIKHDDCVIITNEKIVGYDDLKVKQIIVDDNSKAQTSDDTITVTKSELLELFNQFIETKLSVGLNIRPAGYSCAEVQISLEIDGKEISSNSSYIHFP